MSALSREKNVCGIHSRNLPAHGGVIASTHGPTGWRFGRR